MHIPAARSHSPYSSAMHILLASKLAAGEMESTNPINFIGISCFALFAALTVVRRIASITIREELLHKL